MFETFLAQNGLKTRHEMFEKNSSRNARKNFDPKCSNSCLPEMYGKNYGPSSKNFRPKMHEKFSTQEV